MSETQGQSGYQYGFYYNMYCVIYIYILVMSYKGETFNGYMVFFGCCWYSYTFHCCGTKFDVYMSFYTLALYVMILMY